MLVLGGVLILIMTAGCMGLTDNGEAPADDITENPAPTAGDIEVHIINVGQAESTLLIAPSGETILVDSGNWPQDGEEVLTYLEAQGVDRIDHLVTTHPHADHIGGHEAVIEHYETNADGVGAVWDSGVTSTSQTYEEYIDAIARHNVTLYETRAGDELPIDGVNAQVLHPPTEFEPSDDAHAGSVALRVQHGNMTFITTGDAEVEAEEWMVDTYGTSLTADVYQVGHHGSTTSSAASFLEQMNPAVAVISSDYESQYGHPHEETLTKLAQRDIDTYWTATHGTVVLKSDGTRMDVLTQADAPTDPTQLRDGSAITVSPTDPPSYRGSYNLTTTGTVTPAAIGL